VIRDIQRKIASDEALKAAFAQALSLSHRVLTQKKRQHAPKLYALHAPEVECIGKGKAHKPYEFRVKVSIATTVAPSQGGQFILHAKALPGNPYDGHTLKTVLPAIEAITGAALSHPRRCRLQGPQRSGRP
jgi:IS5 family transposase